MSDAPAETTTPAQGEAQANDHADQTDWKAEARKWESRAKENKTQLDQLNESHGSLSAALSAALGLPADQAVSKLPEVLGGLQSALAIERLARAHKITNDDDIAALSAVSDAQAREKLAARLASLSTPTQAGDDPYPRPKPDATQGAQNDPAPLNGSGIENAIKSALGIA